MVKCNSPAEYAGLRSGDILINQRKKIHEMTLEKVLAILQKEPEKRLN